MSSQREYQRNRKRTAYHEAGHALIGACFGVRQYRVSIRTQDDLLGEVRYRYSACELRLPYTVSAQLLHALAGIAAQDRYSRRRDTVTHGGAEDFLDACDLHTRLLALTVGACAFFEEFEHEARFLLRKLWPAVVDFAELLLLREVLEDEDLDQALFEASQKSPERCLLDAGLYGNPSIEDLNVMLTMKEVLIQEHMAWWSSLGALVS